MFSVHLRFDCMHHLHHKSFFSISISFCSKEIEVESHCRKELVAWQLLAAIMSSHVWSYTALIIRDLRLSVPRPSTGRMDAYKYKLLRSIENFVRFTRKCLSPRTCVRACYVQVAHVRLYYNFAWRGLVIKLRRFLHSFTTKYCTSKII